MTRTIATLLALGLLIAGRSPSGAAELEAPLPNSDNPAEFPPAAAPGFGEALWEILTLKNYNTRLVILSTSLMGAACGLIGGFLLLRKRSLMGDTLSHATLPGICLAFMFMVALGGNGKNLSGLLLGASLTGLLGCASVLVIRQLTRLKDDAAMGIVLSVFYGLGIVLLSIIQGLPQASAAGLQSFLYGKVASIIFADFIVIALVTVASIVGCVFLYKEFRMLCFDEVFAATQGWPVHLLDIVMLTLVAAVTVVGLQAVGLILVIAFLITPAAAARFWTHHLGAMLAIGALIGSLSGWLGTVLSSLFPRLPAGAVIVLTAAVFFLISMLFGPAKGVSIRLIRHRKLKRKIAKQHLLRAAYEWLEIHDAGQKPEPADNRTIPLESLLKARSWTPRSLQRQLRSAYNHALIERYDSTGLVLSEAGFRQAARATRNHRLWELYLIENAAIAPSHVDRDADTVEHILGEALTRELVKLLPARQSASLDAVPGSPHPLKRNDD